MDEHEWRFVTYIAGDFPDHTRFREKGDLLIPYLQMSVRYLAHSEPPPIKEIVIGPALHDPDIKDTLNLLFKSEGYGQDGIDIPTISKSKTVIRGY